MTSPSSTYSFLPLVLSLALLLSGACNGNMLPEAQTQEPTAQAQQPKEQRHSLIDVPEFSKAELAIRQTEVRNVLEQVNKAVVHVSMNVHNTFRLQRDSSGVVISGDGLVLTNWHLVAEAIDDQGNQIENHQIKILTADGVEYPAKLVQWDAATDLALLQATVPEGTQLISARLGDSQTIKTGETMIVVARPDEKIYACFVGAAAQAMGGIRIGTRTVAKEDILIADANLKNFADGCALFDLCGHLQGIANASMVRPPLDEKKATEDEIMNSYSSFGFATKVNAARRVFAKELAASASPKDASANDSSLRHKGIATVIAKAESAIVSVRPTDVTEMPKVNDKDPYGKDPKDKVGSGVIVDKMGLVLTNTHIVGKAETDKDVIVTLLSGLSYPGKVISKDTNKNLTLIQLTLAEGEELPFLPLANSGDGILGEKVAALGNRYGHTLSVRSGVLSSKQRSKEVGDQHAKTLEHFQTDATINNSNTGGALINLQGELLGVNDSKANIENQFQDLVDQASAKKKDTTISFAIPADWIRSHLREILSPLVDQSSPLIIRPPVDAAAHKARENQATRIVAERANCFLNVFVKKVKSDATDGGVMDDLFGDDEVDDSEYRLLGQGSGVIIDPTGLALTNWHVVDAATYKDGAARKDHKVFVSMASGKKYEVEILSTSRIDDLALLQLKLEPGEVLDAINLGDSDSLQVGESVIAVGNPHGFANSVTIGVVSAKNRDIKIGGRARMFRGLTQTDAAINPGNSGGALIDLNGYLVGINSAGNSVQAKVGFAIPVNYVREKFNKTLTSSDKLRSVFLGMHANQNLQGHVTVQSVVPYSPAAEVGIQKGDRILKAQGQEVLNSLQYMKLFRAASTGQQFPLELEREGKSISVSLQPLSDASWAIFRRANFAVKSISFADGEQSTNLLKQTATAAYREFTHDPEGVPTQIHAAGLVVTHVHPGAVSDGMDLQKGDVIAGVVEVVEDMHLGERNELVHIHTLPALRNFIRSNATEKGREVEVWVVRNDKVIKTKIFVKKVKVK